MDNNNPVRIGGVPEHFNLPWRLLLASEELEKLNIAATWQDRPSGTGDMVRALNSGELDMAVLLTEGAIAGIDKGGEYKIVSLYVDSPLIWGIHVASDSPYQSMEQVKGLRYAISRYGSGSHLMAYLDAQNRSWPLEGLKFEVIKNLDGARKALKTGEAEVFFWEKFTTQPYVDNGEFRRIGECPTPYPCFVVCASHRFLERAEGVVGVLLERVFDHAKKLVDRPDNVSLISNRYGLQPLQVAEWLKITHWVDQPGIDMPTLDKVVGILKQLGLVNPKLTAPTLLYAMDPA